ncbi:MAG: methenyltetrahydromethanopterin cyclohydrolase [Chloroflexota bacterium]
MISVNRQAATIVEQMAAQAQRLGITVTTLSCGARVIDLGLKAAGGLPAGKCTAEASLGGMGQVTFVPLEFGDNFWLPGVSIAVDQPEIGCMASQYAGWAIKREKFFAMGSGPARALYAGEELFAKLDYKDRADMAILLLEGRKLPDEGVAEYVAGKCRVAPGQVIMAIAPTASLVGSAQVAARVVETGLHKLVELGWDIKQIVAGYGTCPIAPVASDDLRAIGRTNDGVLYGGQTYYTVRADDAELAALVEKVPSSSSRDYGTPFYDLFQRYGGDFYKIDPLLFSPAQVTFNNLTSGRTFSAGQVNAAVLRTSLLEGV